MSAIVQLLAGHGLAAGRRAAVPLTPAGAAPPNPAPQAPPGLQGPVTTMVAWGKWGVLVCGVAGLLICAGKMAIGHRNRATFAADGATGIPCVLGALTLAPLPASILSVFPG